MDFDLLYSRHRIALRLAAVAAVPPDPGGRLSEGYIAAPLDMSD
jgi:hypothetical protein